MGRLGIGSWVVGFVFVLAAQPPPEGACGFMNLQTICQVVQHYSVFVGQVVDETAPYPGDRPMKVKVEEAFFNSPPVNEQLIVGTGFGANCYFDLKAGGRYIMYATRVPQTETTKPAQFRLVPNTHTRPVKGGEFVLAAFRALRDKQPIGLYGRVAERTRDGLPMEGVKIEIEGPSTQRSVMSDANGEFRIADIAAGEYRVRVSKSGYVRTETAFADAAASTGGLTSHSVGIVEISSTTCNAHYFMMTPTSRIYGVVRDNQGRTL